MNVHSAIQSHRSVRHFDPDHTMSDQEIEKLLSLALHSPSAFNIQNWRFVIMQNAELRRQLRKVSWNQQQVTDASLLIIICADLKAWKKEPIRYWNSAPLPVQEYIAPAIRQYYYQELDPVQRDETMRSCGIAAQTIMLAAKSMGYDSCPMDGFSFEEVAEIINLPDDHAICMFVAIGKALKNPAPKKRMSLSEFVMRNSF
ncbi:nitroreductase family protein [Verrucomicrobia bacterium S94]|nr:nitroreductase family protein [Verrucomicrobia bacterium S94]